MRRAGGLPLAAWLGVFRFLRRWHRYEVVGIETLLRPGAALLVGYHGRPLALDQCMLTVELYERLGYLPHGVIHGYFGENRLLRWGIEGLGFVTSDGADLGEVVARGEHVMVQPGGTREGCRSFRERYRVAWGERVGYLRLALKYRLPIIPVAGDGVDDAFIGLNDGYALGRRLHIPYQLPVWIGFGATGPWPLSLPLPVKMTDYVGTPITRHLDEKIDPRDRVALARVHHEVAAAVQRLLDDARRVGRHA